MSSNWLFLPGSNSGTLDYLESKIENGEHVASLPSCNVPFLAWVSIENGIEIQEFYFDLMLHTDIDLRGPLCQRDQGFCAGQRPGVLPREITFDDLSKHQFWQDRQDLFQLGEDEP